MTDAKQAAYDAQRREQIRAWLRTSYSQRIAWLEQAKQFAAKALAQDRNPPSR
jgi:capsid protein